MSGSYQKYDGIALQCNTAEVALAVLNRRKLQGRTAAQVKARGLLSNRVFIPLQALRHGLIPNKTLWNRPISSLSLHPKNGKTQEQEKSHWNAAHTNNGLGLPVTLSQTGQDRSAPCLQTPPMGRQQLSLEEQE